MIDERQWHLDKRVPVAIIIAILVQTGGMVWWASNLTARVSTLEERQTEQRDQIRDGARAGQDTSTSLARLEEAVKALKEAQSEGFARIERGLREKTRDR